MSNWHNEVLRDEGWFTFPRCECGGRSLAEVVDHSCDLCEDLYKLCVQCNIELGTEEE